MARHKRDLLRQHRLRKRLLLVGAVLLLGLIGTLTAWWWALGALLAGWLAHEAWFSDHLFYAPNEDHIHPLNADWERDLVFDAGMLSAGTAPPAADTWVLQLHVRSGFSGYFRDPHVAIDGERFDFELGAHGQRHIVLTAARAVPGNCRWSIVSHHCRISGPFTLHGFAQADYSQKRVLIIAPHADDAELAAFGLYRQSREVMIVTLTQGEIEAKNYQRLGLDTRAAARLKGRLRSWDSIAIPLWGKVPAARCLQLGYFCMQLTEMLAAPTQTFGSRESGETDIRPARQWNQQILPADTDGLPTGANLVADLAAVFKDFSPQVIVTPHPERDPHPDHVAATRAVQQALAVSSASPDTFLLYANHLHNNDRWPLGPAGAGMTLPPEVSGGTSPERYWCLPLSPDTQLDKAMGLAMQHDLQSALPRKKRLRRTIQRLLTGRTWPATGDSEFFRKAVRSCELFAVRELL